jgi:biopolymer transport protein ExbD
MARSKPSERRHREEGDDEALVLDVTPFLNIMFMLILSTLAMTSWTQLSMLNVQAPQIGGGASDGTGGVTPPEQGSALNLTVFVLRDGFNVGAVGATLDGNSDGRPGQPLFPKVEVTRDGKKEVSYDFQGLQRKLIELKKDEKFKAEESMIISADPDVPYDVIIRVMDSARKTSDGTILFPAVAFAAGVVG